MYEIVLSVEIQVLNEETLEYETKSFLMTTDWKTAEKEFYKFYNELPVRCFTNGTHFSDLPKHFLAGECGEISVTFDKVGWMDYNICCYPDYSQKQTAIWRIPI